MHIAVSNSTSKTHILHLIKCAKSLIYIEREKHIFTKKYKGLVPLFLRDCFPNFGEVSQTLGSSPAPAASFPKLWESLPNFGKFPRTCGVVSQTSGELPSTNRRFRSIKLNNY